MCFEDVLTVVVAGGRIGDTGVDVGDRDLGADDDTATGVMNHTTELGLIAGLSEKNCREKKNDGPCHQFVGAR